MKTQTITQFTLASLLVLIYFSCQQRVDTLEPISLDYYPLMDGKYKIYQVDSTIYDEFNCAVFYSSCQIKEVSLEMGTDGEGDPIYHIQRFIRKDNQSPWKLQSVWSEKLEDNQLQRIEENQRFVKMIFPVQEGTTWDGLSYIKKDTTFDIRGGVIEIYKDWDDFKYTSVAAPFVDTSQSVPITYSDAVQVLQTNKENLLDLRYSSEVYAKNIGLVYKEMQILGTYCLDANCTVGSSNLLNCKNLAWKDKAERGYIVVQSLLEHNY